MSARSDQTAVPAEIAWETDHDGVRCVIYTWDGVHRAFCFGCAAWLGTVGSQADAGKAIRKHHNAKKPEDRCSRKMTLQRKL